ncbi:hypothetical protein [Leptotrichia trevisanii]|uniref:hypothetical protein n=1 Tax=Leptotrichia trevisanii TaxID=109328 RepID=UPI0026F02C1D|nr:hypothetical protein [Leptotrichia trevisanii]
MLRKMVKASVVLIIASLGVIAYPSDNDNGKAAASYSQKKASQIDNGAAAAAEKFINKYLASKDFDKWLKNAPVTSRFRNEIKERSHVLSMSELLLGERIKMEDLSVKDKKLLKKYGGVEYDPILGLIILDLRKEESEFKVKSFDSKTGIIVLKDKWEKEFLTGAGNKEHQGGQEITLKMLKVKGKWLVDGIIW